MGPAAPEAKRFATGVGSRSSPVGPPIPQAARTPCRPSPVRGSDGQIVDEGRGGREAAGPRRMSVRTRARCESQAEGRALRPPSHPQPEELLGPLTDLERRAAARELHLRGDRKLLELGTRVAVVGSRRASPQRLEWTRPVTEALVAHDVTVVSGLALGIDTVAHRTALDLGGKTVAVLGTGLDQYAVSSNRGLQDEIGERGLLVSQFPTGSTPNRSNFPRRNKTMALLSDATLVVEAAENSGTRHQGWEAIGSGWGGRSSSSGGSWTGHPQSGQTRWSSTELSRSTRTRRRAGAG